MTPLNLAFWQEELQAHQDKEFTKLILKGLSSGFRIGFNPHHLLMGTLQPARRNMLSALEHHKQLPLEKILEFERKFNAQEVRKPSVKPDFIKTF